jgi:hypothetical protein
MMKRGIVELTAGAGARQQHHIHPAVCRSRRHTGIYKPEQCKERPYIVILTS